MEREPAAEIYDAYGDEAAWKNYAGLPMPLWEDLPEKIRQCWRAAFQRAIKVHLERALSVDPVRPGGA